MENTRGNLDHSGLRWTLGSHGFSIFPHSDANPLGWKVNEDGERIVETDSFYINPSYVCEIIYVPSEGESFFSYRTIDHVYGIDKNTRKSNATIKNKIVNSAYEADSLKLDASISYGNQSVSIDKTVYSWWHSNHGDLPLPKPLYFQIGQFPEFLSVVPGDNIGTIILSYKPNKTPYSTTEYNEIGVIHPCIYKNGKVVYLFNGGIIAGIHPLDEGGILVVVVTNLTTAILYTIKSSFEQGTAVSIGTLYSANSIHEMRHPWRFNASGTECATIVGDLLPKVDPLDETEPDIVVPKTVIISISKTTDIDGNPVFSIGATIEKQYLCKFSVSNGFGSAIEDTLQPIAINYVANTINIASIDYSMYTVYNEHSSYNNAYYNDRGELSAASGASVFSHITDYNTKVVLHGKYYNLFLNGVGYKTSGSANDEGIGGFYNTSHSCTASRSNSTQQSWPRDILFLDIKNDILFFIHSGIASSTSVSGTNYVGESWDIPTGPEVGFSSSSGYYLSTLYYKDSIISSVQNTISNSDSTPGTEWLFPVVGNASSYWSSFSNTESYLTTISIYRQSRYTLSIALDKSIKNTDVVDGIIPLVLECTFPESAETQERIVHYSNIGNFFNELNNQTEISIEQISPIGVF